jgi:Asp/Glu/hydantoin racemase
MRLLVINPNISEEVSALIEKEALRSAAPTTELVIATARYGFEYIETRFESLVAAGAVAELVAEHHGKVDGMLVAAFGDPGMPALKEISDVPVVGITEAALCAAALQGQRLAVVAISDRITAWYRDCIDRFGLGSRVVSIRSIKEALGGIGTVQDDFQDVLVDLARASVSQDGADVVILAGAPLAGLARYVTGQVPVPVVDGIAAGVRMLEAVCGLDGGSHRAGSFAPPPRKPRRRLSPVLDAALDHLQEGAS